MLKFFRKVKIRDTEVSQFQDNVAAVLQPLSKLPILDGNLVEFRVTSGANKLAHGLGRTPLGWHLADTDAAVVLYRSAASDSSFLTLTADTSATIKLWVF